MSRKFQKINKSNEKYRAVNHDWLELSYARIWLAICLHGDQGYFGVLMKPNIHVVILWRDVLRIACAEAEVYPEGPGHA